jgi:hypothetical protein
MTTYPIIKDIEQVIKYHKFNADWTDETLAEFMKGLYFMRIADIYNNHINELLFGGSSETAFHAKLKNDLLAIDI